MAQILGIDTSNYTTSAALLDLETGEVHQEKQLLPVKVGEVGLRQSDAVFHHTRQLPELLERLPDVIQRKLAKYRRFAVVSVDYTAPGWETAVLQPIGTKDRIACPARACIVN